MLRGTGIRDIRYRRRPAADLISRALAGPAQPPRLSMELRPNVAVGHILHWTDDLGGARVLYQQEYDRAVEQGVETGLPFLLWALAENEGWAGNWPRAEYLAAEGYRLAAGFRQPGGDRLHARRYGGCCMHTGGGSTPGRPMRRAQWNLPGNSGCRWSPPWRLRHSGSRPCRRATPGQCSRAARPVRGSHARRGLAEPALCRFLPDEVEALTRLGELGAAEALLGRFEARSARLGRRWGIAAAGRCRGLLLAARGDLADGLAALAVGSGGAPAPCDAFRGSADAACRRGGAPAGAAQAQGPGVPPGCPGDLRTARRATVAGARPR